uniref:Gamma-butyrobetaine hydroxylase-like N-terminal domain-containing protein n=1 Tax=Hyaloperonospora arabidopsidis (strain Emoy2) TaxID=559515 RepID=M4B4L9_HYAAE
MWRRYMQLLGVHVQQHNRDFLTLRWRDGKRSSFHLLHLRTWCQCPECGHPTGQRVVSCAEINQDELDIETVFVQDETLNIVWNDQHKSSFSTQWLLDNSYSDWALDQRAREMATTPLPLDAPVPSTDFARMMDTNDDEGLYEALRQVIEHGFMVIRNTPSVPGVVKSIAERISPISHSFQYGDVFDVVAEPTPVGVCFAGSWSLTVNIAYTSVYLKNHVDLAYYESPPGFQFMHALRFDASVKGGESTFVDVFAVAEDFRRLHPEHFAILCRVPSTFMKHHLTREQATIMEYQRPHIQVNHRNEVVAVHWSPPFEGPLRVPFQSVMPYYDAYRVFHDLVEGGEHCYEFKLKTGGTLSSSTSAESCMDASNSPHARMGVRHLQGTYINIDDAICRYNVLRTRFGANDPTAANRRVANGNFS